MTTMIALIGEQPQPNFLPVLHYEPEAVVFVYTTKTQQKYEYLKKELQKRDYGQKKVGIYGIETDPYDIAAIVKTLDTYLKEIAAPTQSLMFNLTGGTKPMSLAAYQVAAQYNAPVIYLQSEKGQSIIDRYSWQNHQLYHDGQEVLNKYLNLHDMLNLHLGEGKDTNGKDIWKENGPIIQNNESHLFEIAIAQSLRDHSYEVMCGVIGKKGTIEIDVMARYKNQIGILEAKTGKQTNLEGVNQLSKAMRYLGGTHTKQFLVLDGNPGDSQQFICNILNIKIISLLHYQKGMISLPQEDVGVLLAAIDGIMKVGVV